MQNNYFKHESSYVDDNCIIGAGTKIWHFSHIMSGCQIGEDCNIGQNVVVSPRVILGRNCKVQNNVSIYTGVRCGDDVFLGPSMVFTNVINPRSAVSRKDEYKDTFIRRGASVGANATIVCGNTLGEYCLIGAGSVVTKDVPAFALMVGNPARRVGWVSRYGEKLKFDRDGFAVCPATGATSISLQALEYSAVLTVYRKKPYALFSNGFHNDISACNKRFFVCQSNVFAKAYRF